MKYLACLDEHGNMVGQSLPVRDEVTSAIVVDEEADRARERAFRAKQEMLGDLGNLRTDISDTLCRLNLFLKGRFGQPEFLRRGKTFTGGLITAQQHLTNTIRKLERDT